MNGCSYIEKDTGQRITWTKNYDSNVMQWLLSRGRNIIILEERKDEHISNDIQWLIEKGYMK